MDAEHLITILNLSHKLENNNYIEVKSANKTEHQVDLIRAHKLVSLMLFKLEHHLINPQEEEFNSLFGEKETAINVLTKLSTMLLKFIPLEQQLAQEYDGDENVDISQQDAEFIEQYVARFTENKPQ